MSTYYSAHIAIGYRFVISELLYPFEKHTTEFYHMEKRFDQKTGEELPEVKVIDKESITIYHINNQEFGWYLDFFEELCNHVQCDFSLLGDLNSLESSIVLTPKYTFESFFPGEDFGKVDFSNSLKFSDVLNLEPELLLLKNKLQSLRLRVPEPGVFLAYYYS